MTFHLIDWIAVSLLGGTVGIIAGVFGVGGGFLLVPAMHIFLNVPMELAVGAGACQVLGPATTSILARRVRIREMKLSLMMIGGLLLGVYAGTELLQRARGGQIVFQGAIISLSTIVLFIYFLLMMGLGLFILWESHRSRIGHPIPPLDLAHFPLPPYVQLSEFSSKRASITVLSWLGLAVGFLSGLLGMSGGMVLLPALIYLLGMKTQQAILSTLIVVWIVSAMATMFHAWNMIVDLKLVSALLLGGTIGAKVGAQLSGNLQSAQLRVGYGLLLLLSACGIGLRLFF